MAVPVDLPRGAVAFTVPFVMAFAVAFTIAIAFGPQKSGLSHRVQKNGIWRMRFATTCNEMIVLDDGKVQ